MIELREQSGTPESPYRPIFSAIESGAAEGDPSPQQAYQMYDSYLVERGLDPTIYLSMAITSGGFARDKDLGIGDVISSNTVFGGLAKDALLRQHPELSERDIILPSELGKVRGWSQADYLLFWFHVISGVTVEQAEQISHSMADSLQYPGFVDKDLSADEKWQYYEKFTEDYVSSLRALAKDSSSKLQPNNIQAMIMILDGQMSLGGRAEELLCRKLGIPPQRQMLNESIVVEVPDYQDATQKLQALGASAIGLEYNPASFMYLGYSVGETDYRLPAPLGMRKTGLNNAILAAEYYGLHPDSRPPRHTGHTPLRVPSTQN